MTEFLSADLARSIYERTFDGIDKIVARAATSTLMDDISKVINVFALCFNWLLSYVVSCIMIAPIFLILMLIVRRCQGKLTSLISMPSGDDIVLPWAIYSGPVMLITHFLVHVNYSRGIWPNMLLTVATTYVLWISILMLFLLAVTIIMTVNLVLRLKASADKPAQVETNDEASEPLRPDQIELTNKSDQQKESDLEAARET